MPKFPAPPATSTRPLGSRVAVAPDLMVAGAPSSTSQVPFWMVTVRWTVALPPAPFWTFAWTWKAPSPAPALKPMTLVAWPEVMAPSPVPARRVHR